LPGPDQLSYYARHFDTLELDTTFHAVPPAERVRRWAEAEKAGAVNGFGKAKAYDPATASLVRKTMGLTA
jgi:hypothetical protein